MKSNIHDSLCPDAVRFDRFLYFFHSLLSRHDLVIFPVVLAHEFWMSVEARPLGPVLEQDLLDVTVVNPCTFLELLEPRGRFLLVLGER